MMDLSNHTPVAAQVSMVDVELGALRGGWAVAKATFSIVQERLVLETQTPLPLWDAPIETPLGTCPSDLNSIWGSDRFEVVIMGYACSPAGSEVTQLTVSASVGTVSRTPVVTGDRRWVAHQDGWHASAAEPFSRMPLTWSRAFGGRHRVSPESDVLEVTEPFNPDGRGFGGAARAAAFADELGLARRPSSDDVWLPNVEDVDGRIRRPNDAPRPAGWASPPIASAMRIPTALVDIAKAGSSPDGEPKYPNEGRDEIAEQVRAAVSDWVIERPSPGTPIRIEGMSPRGDLAFSFPSLEIWMDHAVEERRGTLRLQPIRMMILAHEERVCVSYGSLFRISAPARAERRMRLRLEQPTS